MTNLLAAKAIEAMVASQKRVSIKTAKRIIASVLGLSRVHHKKLKPVLELGYSEQLFSLEEIQTGSLTRRALVPYVFEVSAEGLQPMFARLPRAAQEYYAKAVEINSVYVNQVERYLDYCAACKANGTDPVHPKKWICGDMED